MPAATLTLFHLGDGRGGLSFGKAKQDYSHVLQECAE
jgi:hypothetical protein